METSQPTQDPVRGFRILIVDDERDVLDVYASSIMAEGFTNVLVEQNGLHVMERISREQPALVLLDLMMPEISGQELLDRIRHEFPALPVVVITANPNLQTAVECMKAGAFDYIVKPVERQKLIAVVRNATAMQEIQQENKALARHLVNPNLDHPEAFNEIVTRDPSMIALFHYVEAVAQSSSPILIVGETGTGKELFARAIHRSSGRAGELVSINVAGLDDTMFSDMLFGHRKGAFTGADQPLRGVVERAASGTLFLDEIGDLSPASQMKLLRLAESGEYYPLGHDVARRSTARIVAATNRDLNEAVLSGAFRRDLYFRLSTHRITIPPLRERMADIHDLAMKFISDAAKDAGKPIPRLSTKALAALSSHTFPGNVRELRSMIIDAVSLEKADVLSPRSFRLSDSEDAPPQTDALIFRESLPTIAETIHLLIDEALKRSGNNQTVAARLLGISQQALSRRLRNHGDDSVKPLRQH